MSEAKCMTGEVMSEHRHCSMRKDLHPTPPRISFAATLPLQGRVNNQPAAFDGTASRWRFMTILLSAPR